MKNLKKVLAVVLVVIMAFSLVTMASAKTSFTDDKDIKFTTAVGVMTGIGAINGYADGTFNPKGEVTRAEAAKLVAYAVLGPTVAAALKTSTTNFSDVPASHWASPYIEWAVGQGILNGRGDGTFDPTGKVTAFELAKMMLCAAGYGQNDEYVGPNWSIKVATDGIRNEVFKDNETANFSAPATREEAALYVFNGIFRVKQADYNELFGYFPKGGSVTTNWDSVSVKTIAQDTYNMKAVKGLVIGGSVTGALTTGTQVSVATVDKETGKVTAFAPLATYKFEATAADLGQLLDIYTNTDTGKVFYTQTLSKSVMSIFGTSTAYTYSQLFGTSDFTAATAVYKFTDSYKVSSSQAGTNADNAKFLGITVGTVAPAGTFVTYGGEVISQASLATSTFEKVNAISTTAGSESITFSAAGTLSNKASSDAVKEYEGLKVGDYVVLAKYGSIYTAAKTSTVDGKISKISNLAGSPWTVTMDGKDYSASGASGTANLNEKFPSVVADYTDNTYTLYLDANGAFITCVLKTGSSSGNVVYAVAPAYDADGTFGLVKKVQTVNSAGEQVIYTTADGNDADKNPIAGGFYKVTVDSTTKVATFSKTFTAKDDFAVAAVAQTLATSSVKNGANYYYADNTNFVFVSGTKADLKIVKVTGLTNVADYKLVGDEMIYFNDSSSSNKYINTVVIPHAFTGATNAKTVYVSSNSVAKSDSTGYTYDLYVDGVKTGILTTNAKLADSLKNKFVDYTVDSKGVYTISGVSSATNVYAQAIVTVSNIFNGKVTTSNGATPKVFNTTSNVVVVDLKTYFLDPPVYNSMGALETVNGSKALKISYALNKDNEITVIYVEDVVAPEITIKTQPVKNAATVGGEVKLSIKAEATFGMPMTYKWYYSGSAEGAKANEITWVASSPDVTIGYISANLYGTNGAYMNVWCEVSNADGSVKAVSDKTQVTFGN